MTSTGIGRRHFLAALVAALGAGACSSVPLPKMGEGPPNVGVRSALQLGPAPIKGADARFAFNHHQKGTLAFGRLLQLARKLRQLLLAADQLGG